MTLDWLAELARLEGDPVAAETRLLGGLRRLAEEDGRAWGAIECFDLARLEAGLARALDADSQAAAEGEGRALAREDLMERAGAPWGGVLD